MGCTKDYSIKGNMGAALLTQPQLIKSILDKLIAVCTKPVTCKIRILDSVSSYYFDLTPRANHLDYLTKGRTKKLPISISFEEALYYNKT